MNNGLLGFPRKKDRGASSWKIMVPLIGVVDGSNKVFYLPSRAYATGILIAKKISDVTTRETAYTTDEAENIVSGIAPFVNYYQNTGYGYGAGSAETLVDGNMTTFWSSAYNIPIIKWDFTTQKHIDSVGVAFSVAGGFGGFSQYNVDVSDDDSNWTTVTVADVGAAERTLYETNMPTTANGRYWRIYGVSKQGGYEWAVAEVALYQKRAYITTITFTTAPAVSSQLLATYRMYL